MAAVRQVYGGLVDKSAIATLHLTTHPFAGGLELLLGAPCPLKLFGVLDNTPLLP